jgi:hypothetical protein
LVGTTIVVVSILMKRSGPGRIIDMAWRVRDAESGEMLADWGDRKKFP